MRKRWVSVALGTMLLLAVSRVYAHANLLRSDPAANAVLSEPPAEIRLWFTEPLERNFSRITLRDANGSPVDTLPSAVDPGDSTQMSLKPGKLPDGLYTVAWSAVSSADGHRTQGSFPITIGTGAGTQHVASLQPTEDTIPADNALARWLNFVGMALAVGSIGFWLFVWSPALPEGNPAVQRRMRRLIWAGWVLLGLTSVLMLLTQTALFVGDVPFEALIDLALEMVLVTTRFGQLWLVRMGLWLLMGGALWLARRDLRWYRAALLVGGLILLTNSLFSHASAAPDSLASTAADWLHLAATALWVGGLVQFVNVIDGVRRTYQPSAPVLGALVAWFSNFARVAVASLIVTGLYAAWLQVGSLDGLLTTLYGQVLIVKIVLILPLLMIALINLVFTHRGLRAGNEAWGRRLRGLVTAEIVLTLSVLGAVGVLTSISPARNTLAVRAAAPPPAPTNDLLTMQSSDDLHIHLNIYPGWVGQNTFTVSLLQNDMDGKEVSDASLIRLRFDSLDQDIGTSELRPQNQGDGNYVAAGANLSVPGNWRIRMTVQRPGKYDAVTNFNVNMQLPPPLPPPPLIDPAPVLSERAVAFLLAGVVALAAAGFFIGENRLRLRLSSGAVLLTGGLFIGGCLFLVSGVRAIQAMANTAPLEAPQLSENAPIKLAIQYKGSLPHLLTVNGVLLRPDDSGIWRPMQPGAKVTDLYIDPIGNIWTATDAGMRVYMSGAWQKVDDVPEQRIKPLHGYMLTFGVGKKMARLPSGNYLDLKNLLHLTAPPADEPPSDLVMLGDHSFTMQSDQRLFQTFDGAQTWASLDAPAPVNAIGANLDGNLLVSTPKGMYTWNYDTKSWDAALPLPDGQPVTVMDNSADQLFALAGGRLYRQDGKDWARIDLPDSQGAYLTSLQFQYPDTFWVLDVAGARLWSSTDGDHWTLTSIVVKSD